MVAETFAFVEMGLVNMDVLKYIVGKIKMVIDNISLPSSITDVDIANGILMDNKRRHDSVPFVKLSIPQSPESIWIQINPDAIDKFVQGVSYARKIFTNG